MTESSSSLLTFVLSFVSLQVFMDETKFQLSSLNILYTFRTFLPFCSTSITNAREREKEVDFLPLYLPYSSISPCKFFSTHPLISPSVSLPCPFRYKSTSQGDHPLSDQVLRSLFYFSTVTGHCNIPKRFLTRQLHSEKSNLKS